MIHFNRDGIVTDTGGAGQVPDGLPFSRHGQSGKKTGWYLRLARRVVLDKIKNLTNGKLEVRDPMGGITAGAKTPICREEVILHIHDMRFYGMMMARGSLGAAESYMQGDWNTSNLTGLVRLFAVNRHVLNGMERFPARLALPLLKLFHWLNRNTLRGSSKNIMAHYDLGNDFFRLFLDSSMTYSAGIFQREDSTLYDASIAKLDRMCRKLQLNPSDHLLEIGSGWGSLAVHAAKYYGCKVTTITLSPEQLKWCNKRFQREGISDRVEVLLKDYRHMSGQFDKIVSIEMIEAVGYKYYGTYFNRLSRLLKPDGMLAIQAIIIDDRVHDRFKRRVDFIQRYIFPGSCIPSINAIVNAVKYSSDLQVIHLEDITTHYVRTLQEWRRNFSRNQKEIKKLGYPDSFLRMWEYYLCYCEGGFAERAIGDVQMVMAKPDWRDASAAFPGMTGVR